MAPNTFAQQQQHARDLRAQLSELGKEEANDTEMQFIEWSPGRTMQKLWSMQDGIEINIPRYMVAGAIAKRLPDGRYAFTANQAEAPTFKEGDVPCFLAENSPERESGMLEASGLDHLPTCAAVHLRSLYSKRVHAHNRHRQSWETLQDFIESQERQSARDSQRDQVEAMQKLAESATKKAS